MTKIKVIVTEKVCKRCGGDPKPIAMFRTRPNGFTLNQCRKCEGEMNKVRRLKALAAASAFITVTTKSGKTVPASVNPIVGGFVATSPNTEKILYFNQDINRDTARIAFSAFANVPRTGIKYQSC